jgi:hypothetical protein
MDRNAGEGGGTMSESVTCFQASGCVSFFRKTYLSLNFSPKTDYQSQLLVASNIPERYMYKFCEEPPRVSPKNE